MNRATTPAKDKEPRGHRVNREIRIPEVRVTMPDGSSQIMATAEALRMAEDMGVDLVEVAPKARPPVCRLIDYGKFKYQEQKRAQEAKAKQKVTQVKEVKFRPATDENDYQTKLRSVRRFLENGDKAKITLRYRGREMAHQEFGAELLDRVTTDLADVAQVESRPKLEGRQMIMVLGPKRKK
ncbi:translation initiation factor IF-3 [Mesosutterella sp. OilRF-GAM-744-9]|uniref:Translation initiation factor IF-3 n=1 Tax=Mesosutterella porci TaxID=2915351 RepID=A0ABS9MSV6_9BURK|nr:translation initiation factor IF-3 [Mesosutterella sp. oilRF-744-WT-GAM-9]MCG5031713.1 translation initiation factor IF-3 [Mesosutterella sp. oilRF-744-WT-GAM-9]MCI6531140.1 translation initiation factor IF-3 [Mesosutterella sp.]